MSKKQKDFSLIESATEVAALRRELHDSSLSLSIHLNEMADKKTTLLYSSSLNYLNYRLEFAEKEVERLKSIKQHVEELAIKNVTTDEELKDRLINAFDRKNEMISVLILFEGILKQMLIFCFILFCFVFIVL